MLKELEPEDLGKERLKRALVLVLGGGILLGAVQLVASRGAFFHKGTLFGQEQLVDLGGKALNKMMGVLGKRAPQDQKSGEDSNRKEGEEQGGEVAGATKNGSEEGQKAVEKVVEKKVEEIIETIKNLPEEQAETIRKEIMKGICEEVCRIE